MDNGVIQPNYEATLRAQAREALRSGKVPRRKPDRVLGGPGTGKNCVVCGELITLTQMEIEFEFKRQSPALGLDTYRAHPRCLSALELELPDLGPPSVASANDQVGRRRSAAPSSRGINL